MVFAFDYDGTFTADPELIGSWARQAHARGHMVVCCTNRQLSQPIPKEAALNFDAVLYAGDHPKRKMALEAGLVIDLWLDDLPETIGSALLVRGPA